MEAGRALVGRNEGINPWIHLTEPSGANCRWGTLLTKLLLPALTPLPSCPKSQFPPLPLTLIKAQVLLLPPCTLPCCAVLKASQDRSRALGTAPTKAWQEASPSQPDLDGLGIEP